jgi:hypothetical protein
MISSNKMILIELGRIGYKGFLQTHYQSAIKNKLRVIAGIYSPPQARNRFVTETGIPAHDSLGALPEECWSSFLTVATSSNASFSTIKILLSKNSGVLQARKTLWRTRAGLSVDMIIETASGNPIYPTKGVGSEF